MKESKKKEKSRRRQRISAFDVFVFSTVLLLTILIIVPFWYCIVISLSSNEAYIMEPYSLWPKDFTLENYISVINRGSGLIKAYGNTILVSLIGTVLGMLVMGMAAYGLSRNFPGKRGIFIYVLFAMYFGGGTVPTYLNMKNLGLIDTFTGVILLTLCSVGHVIIIMKGFEAIPKSLEESALLDGGNQLQVFFKIMLPLNKPVLVTYALFTFVDLWNGWFWPSLLIKDNNKRLLQVYLKNIVQSASAVLKQNNSSMSGTQTFTLGVQMASIFLVMVPIMMIYPFVQKHFVKGIMVGSVKM